MTRRFHFRSFVLCRRIARNREALSGPKRWIIAACIIAILGAAPRSAHAQAVQHLNNNLNYSLDALMDHIIPFGVTDLRIGIGPAFVPKYEGDNNGRMIAVPALAFRYKDILAMDGTQVRVNLLDLHQSPTPQRLSAGPMIKIELGRHETDSLDLKGLGSVGASVELGGFINYNVGPGRVRLVVRQDIANGHGGAIAELDAGMSVIHTSRLKLAAQVGVIWTSRRYKESFFGVNATQSAASGLPVYAPGAGFNSVTFSVGGEYQIMRHWSIGLQTVYERLVGGSAASPLVQLRGSPNQISLGTFIIYSF